MDFEGDLETEFVEETDPFGVAEIERGVEALRQRIDSIERSLDLSENAQITLADFIDQGHELSGNPAGLNFATDMRLKTLLKMIESSRLGQSYLECAQKNKIKVVFDTQVEHAFYDRESATILIHPGRDDLDLVLVLAREMRRVWQHKSGALIHPLTFHPDQAILVNRAQKADLAANMIRIAWEMHLSGFKGVWERIETSSMNDLARAFAREAFLDFRTINNGLAMSAVFESWFLSDRCRNEDRALIQTMLSDYQGYVFDNEQASRNITADLIIALGSMPFGKNYLSSFVTTITGDPLFTEIRDRSNANFLWFIKFERSFREAEQDLQTPSTHQGHAHPHGSSDIKQRLDGDHEQGTTVIALPGRATGSVPHEQHAGRKLVKRTDSGEGGNIISFPSFGHKRGG